MVWRITFHTFKGSLSLNYSPPTRFNCLCEQGVGGGGGGLEGRIGLPAFAASTLSLWVLRGWRGAWAPRISNILGL